MGIKLFITDERMLQLMELAIRDSVATTETEYLEKISFPRTNISNVRKGLQSFTKEHILNACVLTGASADFIFGLNRSVQRKESPSAIAMLKDAVQAIERELGKSSGVNKTVNKKPRKSGKVVKLKKRNPLQRRIR